jgi:hypothetical protein
LQSTVYQQLGKVEVEKLEIKGKLGATRREAFNTTEPKLVALMACRIKKSKKSLELGLLDPQLSAHL